MKRLLGVNAALNHTDNIDDLNTFQNRMDSEFSVAMVDNKSDIGLIATYAAAHPATSIIGRLYHKMDGGFHTEPKAEADKDKEFLASPEDWMNEIAPIADIPNAWLYVMNEPNTNVDPVKEPDYFTRLSTWTSRWLDMAIARRRRSVMWNFGDRQPMIVNGMWQEWCWGHLRRMATEPDIFMVGMHLYGPDEVVSHVEAYLKTCEMLKITPIPIFATEMGFDTDKGSKESGYHDSTTALLFAKWFGDMFTDESALAPYIRNKVFRGGTIYQWGKLWTAFDIQKDTAFQDAIVDTNLQPLVIPPAPKPEPIKPIDIKFPVDFATRSIERFVKPTRGNQFIRSAPSRLSDKMPIVLQTPGERCEVILAVNLRPEETVVSTIEGTKGTWLPIKINNVEGFVFGGFITAEEIPEKTATDEVPIVVIPPPPPEGITVPTTDLIGLSPVKKFVWSMTFVGTEDENRKALEGINLFMKSAWRVESTEVAP